ncbi:MAG: CDP-alcohol phosphatidyltransferase family protein [Candidatus Natronoplasma sp.]
MGNRSVVDFSLTFPDLITVTNALLGFLSITYVVDGRFLSASLLLVLCVGLDGLDGFLARYLGVEHELGAYLDFFSDLISFCFAPSLLLYSTYYDMDLGRAWQSSQNALATLVPFLIVFFGTMRLSRFVDKTYDNSHYKGLPTPCLALLVINSSYLFGWGATGWYHPHITLFILLGFGFLLYAPIPYPKVRGDLVKVGASIFLLINFLGYLSLFLGYSEGKVFLLSALLVILAYIFFGPFMVSDHGKE